MKRIVVLAAVAVILSGCACGDPTSRGASASVGLSLPPLSEVFTGPPKPVCMPKDGCLAAYGDGWQVLGPCGANDATPDPMVSVPASLLRAVPDSVAPTAVVTDVPAGYPRLIKRTVTTFNEEGKAIETTTDVPAAAGDCP